MRCAYPPYGHRKEILDLARRYGVTNVRVFGSMARGDADESSDVDLLVTLPPGVSGLALGGLLMDVQVLTGRRVDVATDDGLHPLTASASRMRHRRCEGGCRCDELAVRHSKSSLEAVPRGTLLF
jgi:predicted nucleotidyltransferase